MFLTHDPTQPTKKLKISTQPNPTQPRVDLVHGQLPVGRPNAVVHWGRPSPR